MEHKPLAVGTLLKNRYQVTRLVAGGGMAWVYEVEELRHDGTRAVWAMKELRADADDTHSLEEGRRLFEQEANILVHSEPSQPAQGGGLFRAKMGAPTWSWSSSMASRWKSAWSTPTRRSSKSRRSTGPSRSATCSPTCTRGPRRSSFAI